MSLSPAVWQQRSKVSVAQGLSQCFSAGLPCRPLTPAPSLMEINVGTHPKITHHISSCTSSRTSVLTHISILPKLEGKPPQVPTDRHFVLTNVQEKVTKAFKLDSKHDQSPLLQSANCFILAKRRDFPFLPCNSYMTWASLQSVSNTVFNSAVMNKLSNSLAVLGHAGAEVHHPKHSNNTLFSGIWDHLGTKHLLNSFST